MTTNTGLPTSLHARIANALGVTPEALVPLLERLRDAGLVVVPRVATDEMSRQTRDRIESYRDLPVGWHYGRGGPIPSVTVDLALRAETMIRDDGWPETHSFPGCDGEIQMTGYRVEDRTMVTVEVRIEIDDQRDAMIAATEDEG